VLEVFKKNVLERIDRVPELLRKNLFLEVK